MTIKTLTQMLLNETPMNESLATGKIDLNLGLESFLRTNSQSSLLISQKAVTNQQEIAENFNNFFTSVFTFIFEKPIIRLENIMHNI